MGKFVLNGKRIYLESLIVKVTPEIIQLNMNDIELTKYMNAVPYPYAIEDANRYIKFLNVIKDDETMLQLGIFDNQNNEFIGVVSLEGIDFEDQNAELGYWIAKKFWGKGYAKEAATVILEYAFKKLDLFRIYATLQKENIKSLALLTSFGFQVEGLARNSVKNKGVFVDHYKCGLLKREWEKKNF